MKVDISKRFPKYSKLLKLFPATYHKQYAEQMLYMLGDMLDNAPSRKLRGSIWIRTIIEFPISLSKQQLSSVGEIMTQQTPRYITSNAEIGAALLVPFFVVIIFNSLSYNSTLSDSHWLNVILLFLVAGLPTIAFALNFGTFITWTSYRWRKQKVSFWRSVFDLRYNWPMVMVAGLGFLIVVFIFGHDSVHCVTQYPIHSLQNWRTTMKCFQTS